MVDAANIRAALLAWYDSNARTLPWRIPPGALKTPNPYHVWLSEVMLQQTTAAAVGPYFTNWLRQFPDVQKLAAAPLEAVLAAWAGLGYYARARNLHKTAKILAVQGFPSDENGWRALPGIGEYTAAAIAAIALDQPANAVDGNIERVIARLFAQEAPLPAAKPLLRADAAKLVSADRPGDWIQALMDLGATICTPKAPKCSLCPIRFACRAVEPDPQTFPRRQPKPPRPERHGAAFWLERDGHVLIVQRPAKGLLGGMLGLPATEFRPAPFTQAEIRAAAPDPLAQWRAIGEVRHVFTHFSLRLAIWRAPAGSGLSGRWFRADAAALAPLPTIFRKAAALCLDVHP